MDKPKIIISKVDSESAKHIKASYNDEKEFELDEKGYFLIRVLPETKEIEVGLCEELNKVSVIIKGKKPLEIYQTAIKEKILSRMDHAAYLGRELQKAYDALKFGKKYIQDAELN